MWYLKMYVKVSWNQLGRDSKYSFIFFYLLLPHFQSNLLWLLQIDASEAEETFSVSIFSSHTHHTIPRPRFLTLLRGEKCKKGHMVFSLFSFLVGGYFFMHVGLICIFAWTELCWCLYSFTPQLSVFQSAQRSFLLKLTCYFLYERDHIL